MQINTYKEKLKKFIYTHKFDTDPLLLITLIFLLDRGALYNNNNKFKYLALLL